MSKKDKHYFFCANYTSLNQVLEILSTRPIPFSSVTLVISESSLFELVKQFPIYQKVKVLFLPYLNSPVVSPSPLTVLYHRRKFEHFFQKHFSQIKHANIYFFSQIFWETGFKIIQKLSRQNQIYFYSVSPSSNQLPHRPWETLLLRTVYGLDGVKVVLRDRTSAATLSNQFFNLYHIESLTPQVNYRKYNIIKRRFFGRSITSHKVLILVDGDSDNRYIDPKKRNLYLTKVVNFLKIKYPKEGQIIFKKHPRVIVSLSEDLEKLADPKLNVLPAELLLHPKLEFNIGIISTTLMYPQDQDSFYANIGLYPLVARDPDLVTKLRLISTEHIFLPKSFPDFKRFVNQRLKSIK